MLTLVSGWHRPGRWRDWAVDVDDDFPRLVDGTLVEAWRRWRSVVDAEYVLSAGNVTFPGLFTARVKPALVDFASPPRGRLFLESLRICLRGRVSRQRARLGPFSPRMTFVGPSACCAGSSPVNVFPRPWKGPFVKASRGRVELSPVSSGAFSLGAIWQPRRGRTGWVAGARGRSRWRGCR